MATLSDVTTRVLNLLGTSDHLSATEAKSMIQTRFETLYEEFLWSSRMREFTLNCVAQLNSGTTDTVTATNGSATIISAGSPFTSAMIGRQIQIGSELQYYFINAVGGPNSITLGDGNGNSASWPGSTASGLMWRVFQTVFTLGTEVEGVYTFADDLEIDELDGGRPQLDRMDGSRRVTAIRPRTWCYAGKTDAGARQIEMWPVPTTNATLRGQMIKKAPLLTDDTTIVISVPLLTFASVADCAGMLFSKTGDESWGNLQLFYERKSNEIKESVYLKEMERLSLPKSIGRIPRGRQRYLGTDYEVSHHADTF